MKNDCGSEMVSQAGHDLALPVPRSLSFVIDYCFGGRLTEQQETTGWVQGG